MTKKRHRVRAALLARALDELEEDATPLDYVCDWLASGYTLKGLAAALAVDMGESCSRSFMSLIAHRLAPDATARIGAARLVGADALLEIAAEILNDENITKDTLPSAKLRLSTTFWLAAKQNRVAYGSGVGEGRALAVGALHLAALIERNSLRQRS